MRAFFQTFTKAIPKTKFTKLGLAATTTAATVGLSHYIHELVASKNGQPQVTLFSDEEKIQQIQTLSADLKIPESEDGDQEKQEEQKPAQNGQNLDPSKAPIPQPEQLNEVKFPPNSPREAHFFQITCFFR